MPSRAVCKGVVVVVVVHRVQYVSMAELHSRIEWVGLDWIGWDYSRNAGREFKV
jgi:hypothetical protein